MCSPGSSLSSLLDAVLDSCSAGTVLPDRFGTRSTVGSARSALVFAAAARPVPDLAGLREAFGVPPGVLPGDFAPLSLSTPPTWPGGVSGLRDGSEMGLGLLAVFLNDSRLLSSGGSLGIAETFALQRF